MLKKLLLFMMLCATTVTAWGQFYKFTATANGNLYTAKNDASVATTPKDALCEQSYYVKSSYQETTAPEYVELKTFSTNQYFVFDGENYTSAFGQEYDINKTYATASGQRLEGDNLQGKLKTSYVFKNNGDGEKAYRKVGDSYVMVQIGDECDLEETYYWGARENGNVTGETIKGYGMLDEKPAFISTNGIYVKDGDEYVAITSSLYESSIEYYTLSYTNLTDDEETAMADNSANFNITNVVTGLSDPSGIFYFNAGEYTQVQNGDEFLGADKYYVPGEDFILRNPAELVALGYVKAVGAITQPSDDGKTLTILCSGDVCDPDDEFASTGYKFAAKAVNTIYPGEVENSVKLDEVYNENLTYYTRAQKYKNEEILTTPKYTLKEGVVAYSHNPEGNEYTKIATGTDVSSGTYYELTNAGVLIEDFTDITDEKTIFNSTAVGYIYIYENDWTGYPVKVNDVYDDTKAYVKLAQADNWYGGRTTIDRPELDTYLSENVKIITEENIFVNSGDNYLLATGKPKDDDLSYYKNVLFDNIELTNGTNSDVTYLINTNGKDYFTRSGSEGNYIYNQVANGSEFTGNQSDYFVKNGFVYTEINESTLCEDVYMTSVTVANNYWEAMANEINKNRYETVVFATKEGDAEPATICNTVTRAMMLTTTVNALDYEKVQISSIESALIGGSSANPKGTFLYPSEQMKDKNESITILLLPQIKDVENIGGKAHKHVPSYCCTQFPNLKLIVMPDNATCIEDHAFSTGAGGFSLETIVFNNTLERIESNAFNGNTKLKTLTFPATLKYIGQYAFNGGLNDVYFLGKDAPIVEKDAFGTEAYLNNNAIDDQNMEADWYRITRDAYVSKNGYMAAMLHLPAGMSDAQRAAYTDPTRSYHVFEYLPYTMVKTTDKKGNAITTEEEALFAYPQATDATVGDDGKITLYYGGIKSNNIDDEKEADLGGVLHKVYYCSGDASGANFTASWGNASASGVNAVMAGGRVWNSNLVVGKTFAFYPWGKGNFTAYTKGSDENYVEVEVNTEYNKEETYYICGTDETDIPAPNSYTVLTFDELKQKSIVLEVDVKGGWINDSNQNRWKNSGFYDLNLGMNYIWPSQTYMNRAFTAASRNKLWGGSMTIADGIAKSAAGVTKTTVTFDSNCDGAEDKTYNDGEEYMGLHEFILVTFDVSEETNTQEWDFNTLGGKNWYTICVPVDMTAGEVRKAFGDNTQVCSFNKVERRIDTYQVKIKFGFTEEHCYGHADNEIAIKANEAYMIRPGDYKDADHTFTLPHYTIAPQVLPIPTTLTAIDGKDGNKYSYTFVGNYNTAANGDILNMQKYSYFLGNAGNNVHKFFFQTGTTGKWKPYTCIIIPGNGEADYKDFFKPADAKSLNCVFGWDEYFDDDDDNVSSIEYEIVCGAENAMKETPIYNLNGQCVGNNMNTLSRGVYIKDGKKFIVR